MGLLGGRQSIIAAYRLVVAYCFAIKKKVDLAHRYLSMEWLTSRRRVHEQRGKIQAAFRYRDKWANHLGWAPEETIVQIHGVGHGGSHTSIRPMIRRKRADPARSELGRGPIRFARNKTSPARGGGG
jgi:hypothetical protein